MSPCTLLGLTCLLLTISQVCHGDDTKNSSIDQNDFDSYVPYGSSDLIESFDWKILQELSLKGYKNVIISPLTLKLALALLYEGSTGVTEKEFQSVLKFPVEKKLLREQYRELLDVLQNDRKSDYVINLGTRIFLDGNLAPSQSYQAKAKNTYDTEIVPTNFTNPQEASRSINSWVDFLTNGRIRKLVHAEDIEDAVLLVTNALYFKGMWRHTFSTTRSFRSGFHVSPSESVTVNYMSDNTTKYFHAESKSLDAQILRIPYKGGKFSMFIILPNSKNGLKRLLSNLDLQKLQYGINMMEMVSVELILPKFKFDFQTRFSKILLDLGLKAMFQNVASFSGIVHGETDLKLVVSDIVQKAGIDVNEEGTTAFAALDIQLHSKFGEPDVIFNVSHPFLFFIEEETKGKILFVGKVENPLEEDSSPLPSRFNDGGGSSHNKATPPPSVVSQQRPQQVPQYDYSTLPEQYDESTARFHYFDWELLRDLNTNDNVLISPASIKSTLAMVLEGAFGNTAREIVNALRLPKDETRRKQVLLQLISSLSDSEQNTTLESSNAVFVSKNYEIIPEYKSKLEYYKAILEQLNFDNPTQAANTINSFIKKATGGLIPEIVTPSHLDPDTAVVITNALYFKAAWKHEFDDSKIKCFYPQGKDCIYTYMMQMIATVNYRQLEEIHGHAVELPYGDNKHAMLILVPSEKNNFKHFVNDVRLQSLARILNRLEQTEIMLELPKFEINYSIDLVDTLKQHDIRDAFDSYANLSGIVYDKKVKISSIIHKTKIIVNEKGTIAAAASGVLVTPLMGSTMPRVIVDHPFLFFIYKIQTRDILFEGILNKPTEAMNTATRTNSNPIQLTNRNTYVSPTQQQQQLINNVRLLQQQPQQNQYQFQ